MQRNAKEVLSCGLTVGELIEFLQDMDPESKVVFACDYGDYHHTIQALPVMHAEPRPENHLKPSAYSHSGIALTQEDSPSYFCQRCGEEWTVTRCPKCGEQCVDETGEYVVDEDECEDVVILSDRIL